MNYFLIALAWLISGLICCYYFKDTTDTKGNQLGLIIFGPAVVLVVIVVSILDLIDGFTDYLNSDAFGKKK